MPFAREMSPWDRSPLPSKERLRRLYRRAWVRGSYWGDFLASIAAPVRRDGAPDRLLDAGCGRGEMRHHMARQGAKVDYYGVDLGLGDETWTCRVTAVADLHRLPFADDSMDKAVCSQVLEHVDDPGVVLSQLARVVRPGGRVFLSVPFLWHMHQMPQDRFRFNRCTLEHMFAKVGLVPDEIRPMGGYFTAAAYMASLFPGMVTRRSRVVGMALDRAWKAAEWVTSPVAHALDALDVDPELTIGYFVQATKPGAARDATGDVYACPRCYRGLPDWTCAVCGSYPVDGGIPHLLAAEAKSVSRFAAV